MAFILAARMAAKVEGGESSQRTWSGIWPRARGSCSRTGVRRSVRTVQAHLTQIFNKLGVGSRTEAVIAGLRRGILHLEDLDEG